MRLLIGWALILDDASARHRFERGRRAVFGKALRMDYEELEGARLALSLAGTLVYCEPDADALNRYLMPGLFDASPFGGEEPLVAEGLSAMACWCERARRDANRGERLAELRDDWFHLVAGPGEPDAPAWAGYYLATNSQILSQESLAVRCLYARHGFEVVRKNREPDDSLGIMLGFLGELAGEVERAVRVGDAGAVQAARGDACELLVRHVLPWVDAWHGRMAASARTSFYCGVGAFACGLSHACAERWTLGAR